MSFHGITQRCSLTTDKESSFPFRALSGGATDFNASREVGEAVTTRGARMISAETVSNPKALKALKEACSPDGVKAAKVSEVTGLSRSATLALLEKMRGRGELTRSEIPHKNLKMPGTFIYQCSPDISPKEIVAAEQSFASNRSPSKEKPAVSQISPGFDLELSAIKPANRADYVSVLLFVAQQKSVTLNQVWKALPGSGKQTHHTRLGKLIALGLIEREKRNLEGGGSQFFYFPNPKLSLPQVEALAQCSGVAIAAPESAPPPTETPENKDSEMTQPASASKPSSPLQSSSISLAERLLEAFPVFNPNWSEEAQEKWLLAIERLTRKMDEVIPK